MVRRGYQSFGRLPFPWGAYRALGRRTQVHFRLLEVRDPQQERHPGGASSIEQR